jgi:amino acid adenylation domain-containing protein/non-ribosomal peptide synthase protein (TIGR01720 family)
MIGKTREITTGDEVLLQEVRQILAEETCRPAESITEEEIREYLELLQSEPGAGETIHAIFEEQAEEVPDAAAVVFGEERLSYGEANRQANRLAHALRELGVGPGIRVGIYADRSPELVLSLLGVLKAGGAYVALDPSYPRERLAHMLRDAEVSILLARESCLETLPEHRAPVVLIGRTLAALGLSEENPEPLAGPEDPTYVMYTSGSTGLPKGTVIHHANLRHFVAGIRQALDVTAEDVFLHTASFAFAASSRQMWLPFSLGATVVLASAEQIRDPLELLTLARRQRVTVMDIVPSYWQSCVYALSGLTPAEREDLLDNDVRWIFTASEALVTSIPRAWNRDLGHRARTVNLYGQTETTSSVTSYLLPESLLDRVRGVPVGSPLPGTPIYLLDPHLQLVPFGVPGEIHVGGPALSSGYLHLPDQTAVRFIPDPFSEEPGRRLYRTGDLARCQEDGTLEFLGRIDQQVKIHGVRVEVGEIEGVLAQHPRVRQAAVCAFEDARGNRRLAAYVVAERGQASPTAGELRSHLSGRLPDFMVPASIVALEQMPLTPTGKINRAALPTPEAPRPDRDRELVAPGTPAERDLARIWMGVLGLDQVGVHDNFFEVGGDSILAIQVAALASQEGLRLTPRQLVQHQTIAELAQVTGSAPVIDAEQGLVTGPVLLSPAQRWFFEDLDVPDPHHHNQAIFVEVRAPLEPDVVRRALHHLLLHHDALRLRLEPDGGSWTQVNAGIEAAVPPFTLIDLAALKEGAQRSVRQAAAAGLQTSLHLGRGPLLRLALFRHGSGRPDRLLVIVHHLVLDGVSWRVLLEDLHTLCRQLGQGHPPRLAPKTTSFQTFVRRLAEHARSEELRAELPYWLAKARTRVRPLPVDMPGGDDTMASNRTLSATFTPEETRAVLQELPQARHVHAHEVLLTALALSVSHWSGSSSVLVDVVGHGREPLFDDVDLSRTVGWSNGNYPVLLDVGDAGSPLEALERVRGQLRQVPNGGVGYRLLRYLSGDPEIAGRLRSMPRAEILFSYWGQLDQVRLETSSLFGLLDESPGPIHDPRLRRPWLLMIALEVLEERLVLRVRYGESLHRRSTAEELVRGYESALRSLLALARPAAVGVSAGPRRGIVAEPLEPGRDLPLVIRPEREGLDLGAWAARNRRFLEYHLVRHGGLLFRGFGLGTVDEFQQTVRTMSDGLLDYTFRSTPRQQVSGKVYSSTEFPAELPIPLHNEMSYTRSWPLKIWFFCARAPESGGETPIADSRRVFARLDPRLREEFARKRVMYVRNYGSGMDLPWQEVFQTDDRDQVEAYCREHGIEHEWLGPDHLRTRQVCQAVASHPATGEMLWFNQAHLFHISNTDPQMREMLIRELGEDGLPRNSCFGDGSRIDDAVVTEVAEAYRRESVLFPWEEGDLLMLDNMMVAHGRTPFTGARKIVVAMAEAFDEPGV